MSSPSCDDCLDGKIELSLIDGGSPPFDILWDNNDTTLTRMDIGTGSYSVKITDSRGCFSDLFFELDLSYRIPNAFTPNDDGVNDVWKVGIIEYYPEAIIRIFDSKGTLIFESPPGYPDPWDGKVDGEFVSMGTYYYLIYLEPGLKPQAGYLTVLR